jgi:hypothetical protein
VLLALFSLGCAEVDQVFLRESPVVNDAILALKESDPKKSAELLMKYLETGACEGGVIGAGERARSYGDASLDLALALSAVAGGKEAKSAPDPAAALSQGKLPPGLDPNAPGALKDPQAEGGMSEEAVSSIDCALRVLAAISGNNALAPELRARAHYLAGNLEMLRSQYDAAIASYDLALLLTPGVSKEAQKRPLFANVKVDPLGLWVADNRALALRLQKEKEEQEKQKEDENQSNQDEEPKDDQQSEDQGKDGEPKDEKDKQESENEENEEKQEGDQGEEDEQQNPEEKDDQEKQDGESESEPNPSDSPPQDPEDSPSSPEGQEQAAAENQPSEARDQRMLDLLEQAPTLQKHDAEKRKAQGVRFRSTMEDK